MLNLNKKKTISSLYFLINYLIYFQLSFQMWTNQMQETLTSKKKGDTAFRHKDLNTAIECYTQVFFLFHLIFILILFYCFGIASSFFLFLKICFTGYIWKTDTSQVVFNCIFLHCGPMWVLKTF